MFLAQKFAPPTHLAPPTHPKKNQANDVSTEGVGSAGFNRNSGQRFRFSCSRVL